MEYEVISLPEHLASIKKKLNELGDKGYELISIVHQPDASKGLSKPDFSSYIAYFKKT